MEYCGSSRKTAKVQCELCGNPICAVCEDCAGTQRCPGSPRPGPSTGPRAPQGPKTSGESGLRNILREGGKMIEKVTKNVMSAKDHIFNHEDEEEDIDRLVEEFRQAQLEKKKN